MLPPAGDYFASTIEMLDKLDPKVKTVALLSSDRFDVSVAKGTRELLGKAGMKLVSTRSITKMPPTGSWCCITARERR
jgi:branched-chain amino acid transport system substrate-binding protein